MSNYVYTAGPMEHVSKETMEGWRNYVDNYLSDFDIECLHPTRRTPLHEQLEEDDLSTYNKLKRIVAQDMLDIENSKVVLADLRDSMPGKKCCLLYTSPSPRD